MGVPRDPRHLRELNKSLVRNLLRRDGALTRTDIARSSGLTKPTVSAIVRDLVAEGVVVEAESTFRRRSTGARPLVFEYNRLSRLFVGVLIGVSVTEVMLADGLGLEIASRTLPTPSRDPHRALQQAIRAARALLRDHQLPHDRVAAVGVCLPGLVDTDLGRCLLAPNLGWRDVDVASYFATISPTVVVHNVIHAALEAEHLEGAAAGTGDVVLLFEDNGVGAGLLAGGSIFTGAAGLAGELGHCKLRGVTDVCGCGGTGCLETQVSAQAVAVRAGDLLPPGVATAETFAALAASPAPAAQELLRRIGGELGEAAAWVVNIVNPRLVLVGGNFAAGGEWLIGGLQAALRREALPEMTLGLQVRGCELPALGAVRGAVLLARRFVDGSEVGAP